MTIAWRPIDTMPEDRKDGRELLLGQRNTLGTADGGDGVQLNPRWPWLYDLAVWDDAHMAWRTEKDDGSGDSIYLSAAEPDYWADINPPEEAK